MGAWTEDNVRRKLGTAQEQEAKRHVYRSGCRRRRRCWCCRGSGGRVGHCGSKGVAGLVSGEMDQHYKHIGLVAASRAAASEFEREVDSFVPTCKN